MRGKTALYWFDATRGRPCFVTRERVRTDYSTVTRKATVELEDGSTEERELEEQVGVDTPTADVVVLVELEDRKRGVTQKQVRAGYVFLSDVEVRDEEAGAAPGCVTI